MDRTALKRQLGQLGEARFRSVSGSDGCALRFRSFAVVQLTPKATLALGAVRIVDRAVSRFYALRVNRKGYQTKGAQKAFFSVRSAGDSSTGDGRSPIAVAPST